MKSIPMLVTAFSTSKAVPSGLACCKVVTQLAARLVGAALQVVTPPNGPSADHTCPVSTPGSAPPRFAVNRAGELNVVFGFSESTLQPSSVQPLAPRLYCACSSVPSRIASQNMSGAVQLPSVGRLPTLA